MRLFLNTLICNLLLALCLSVEAQVVINEIHYHPTEVTVFDGSNQAIRTFDVSGNPIFSDTQTAADYSDDVHEFIEIYNAGAAAVDLSGWRFSTGVLYTFPNGTSIPVGGYKVIAKNVSRIQSVYGITGVLGPFLNTGTPALQTKLSNNGDTLTLMNAANTAVDSVSYSSRFPWAQSADGLGVAQDWLGFDPLTYQYKGRSLQRVSVSASSNAPANWLASPLSPGPTPGSANAVTLPTPRPVVLAFSAAQASDGSPTIRVGQAVTIGVTFSGTASLSAVEVQYFSDDINSFTETRTVVSMTESPVGSGQYSAAIPGMADRSVVRYRFRANRGAGLEAVSPRADDPAIVPVGAAVKEAWHAYFVTPVRTSVNPIYDCLISSASLTQLGTNINQGPSRRITAQGDPRERPYVAATDPQWNGVQPAIVVHNGVVYDIMFRHHGSRYRRGEGRQSYKWQFPRGNLFQGSVQEVFETDKARDTGNHPNTEWGHLIYRTAGIVTSYTQRTDLYMNGNGLLVQLEQSVCDDILQERYYEELYKLDKSVPKQTPGEVYKAKGTDEGGNGPYITFTGQQITANRTSGTGNVWTPLQQYRWNMSLQNTEWKGHKQLKDMIDGLWAARNTGNATTIRAWCNANWDMDKMLTAVALRNWSCAWDDTFHNFLLQRQSNGKWMIMPWDFDYEFADRDPATGIYSTNNSVKETVINYFNAEYKSRMWLLNNTLLTPTNLLSLGIDFGTWTQSRVDYVNATLGLGAFQRPVKPVTASPTNAAGVVPPVSLVLGAYSHTSGNTTGNNAHTKTKWEIRTAAGAYADPLYAATSTTNLTTLAIPFADMTLGDTYYWRATFYDALGHPSFISDEASFLFGAGAVTQTLIAMDATTLWKWKAQNITAAPSVWAAPGFNDALWSSGAAPLGIATGAVPVAIRTPIPAFATDPSVPVTKYFRLHFSYPGTLGPTTSLRLRLLVDDGVYVYLNGQELKRVGVDAATTDSYSVNANRTVVNAAYEPGAGTWFTVPTTALVNGDNVLAASLHQDTPSSTDLVFGLELEATYTPTGGNLAINEVCADNRTVLPNGGSFPDYIELINRGASVLDISGFTVTDDPLFPAKYTFPAGTTIPPGGYLIAWCDSDFSAPGLHTGFGLSSGGQSLAIYSAGALVDYVTFGLQAPDLPIGRVPNGSGSFALIAPSPGATNVAKTLGASASLRINEWMASPASGEDWFELYNSEANPVALAGVYLSDSVSELAKTKLPALSFVAGKGFTKLFADGTTLGGNSCNFKLSSGGESIFLTGTNGSSQINSVNFGAQPLNVSQGRLPDGAGSFAQFPQSPSPGGGNFLPTAIVINEALTNSTAPLEDMIELYNPTASSVNIGGWWLSDDRIVLQKYQIPAGITIPAGGYLVFTESQFNSGVTPFSLGSTGDEIVLSATSGTALTGYRAQVAFGAAADGVTFGRVLTASSVPEFWPLTSRSLVAVNTAPKTGAIVINEVMYHPPDILLVDNVRDEFIELHNITTSPQSIAGWKLKSSADFTFATGTTVLPGDYVLVVSFDPATDATSLAAFRTTYNIGASVSIYGPYLPRLSNSSAPIELAAPGSPVGGITPFILMDKVEYIDAIPWPISPDGAGPSLQRVSRTIIGNDPANWGAAVATPGAVNSGQSPILDSDGDALLDAWEIANGLNRFSSADANTDADGDGQSNVREYLAGTNPQSAGSVFKSNVAKIASGFRVQFTAMPGVGYSVMGRDSLSSGVWVKIRDVSAQGTPREETTDDITAQPQRFYQVVTPQQP